MSEKECLGLSDSVLICGLLKVVPSLIKRIEDLELARTR